MSVEKILSIATTEVDLKVVEFPSGSNNVKYNTWFYGHEVHDGDKPGAKYPWCATFVSWVFDQAGINLGTIDYRKGYAGCVYAVLNIPKWGKIITKPVPGCIVFFDWQGDGKFDHTGIFVRDINREIFEAIEGNTSFKDNSNGGGVMRRTDRHYKHALFVLPNVLKP